MLAVKILITVSFLILGGLIFTTALQGRKISRAMRERIDNGVKLRKLSQIDIDIDIHKFLAHFSFCLCFGAVILTEGFVRQNGGVQNKELFWIHLGFAIPLFISLATLRFWMTGLKNPRIHKWLGYLCLASYLGTLTTGLILLWY